MDVTLPALGQVVKGLRVVTPVGTPSRPLVVSPLLSTLCWLFFLSTNLTETQARVAWEEETQGRNCLHWLDLWLCLWDIFFMGSLAHCLKIQGGQVLSKETRS